MNNHFKPFGAFLLLVVALLTGCGNKPPGCADPLTLTTAKQLVEENANKALFSRDVFSDDPDGWMKKFYDEMKVEITGVVSEGYKEDAKKQLCRGTLKITMVSGQTLERAVEYTTQKTEDRKDSFLLEFQAFAPFAAGTAEEARKYYNSKRWAGTWNGTYACSGVNGATDTPQGPYALPVSMSVEGVNAKLERTTRGGGIEILAGQFISFFATDQYELRGEGQNSPDDKWSTSFKGKVTGKRFVADGAITVRGETLRQCKLDLTLGGAVVQQSHEASPPLPGVRSKAQFSGRFATVSGTQVVAEIGEADASGKYLVKVTTSGQTIGGGDCGGVVEGSGSVTGNTLKLKAVSEGQMCELAMTLNSTGKLNIEESDACSNLHGAACGFSDVLTRSR